ncbi:Txe/YoeB family addiction module toxin [Chamaesiphon sp. GL140_3_metabinner_50]|uniref:Txe/YoeB family addiction module toxin n=1 Tax=Chamaesiphon sp. GL140_3_metabinner_50 TaxID=2970812 RepID=UPI0025FF2821|nr:Txe/YoeB family addiction module toxin [Chamaesiphon sp. GL140_3_metabinner_50]
MAKKPKKSEEPSEITPVQIIRLSPVFTTKFKADLGWWYKTDSKKAAKILDLVTAVMSDPFTGIGKPEPLKYLDSDFWSRRIDLEHRLIYIVNNEQIVFFTCRYHYE